MAKKASAKKTEPAEDVVETPVAEAAADEPERAREDDGTFKGDDPSTPENEAYVGGVGPNDETPSEEDAALAAAAKEAAEKFNDPDARPNPGGPVPKQTPPAAKTAGAPVSMSDPASDRSNMSDAERVEKYADADLVLFRSREPEATRFDIRVADVLVRGGYKPGDNRYVEWICPGDLAEAFRKHFHVRNSRIVEVKS